MSTTNMTKKRLKIILCAIYVVLISFLLRIHLNQTNQSGKYNVSTFESDNGWGYQIKKGGKVFIFQPYMPCVAGSKPFPDEESALKTGNVVLLKVNGNEDPTITIEELRKIVDI